MPTLDAFENGMVGVHSTISSSIHEMFSILAQSQLQEQVKKKP
jgi:fluoride ion exporter CrcB/FEX